MDKKKQFLKENHNEEESISSHIKRNPEKLEDSDLSKARTHPLDEIFKQRKTQRDVVLNSISKLMWASFWLLAGIIILQSTMRIFHTPNFILLEGYTLQVLAVSVFGQIIAVVYIISKSLWDDRIYMDIFKFTEYI